MDIKFEQSKWSLLNRIYNAKSAYYGKGNSVLSDEEYDALERSFITIHGESALNEWISVGYDGRKHGIIRDNLDTVTEGL